MVKLSSISQEKNQKCEKTSAAEHAVFFFHILLII